MSKDEGGDIKQFNMVASSKSIKVSSSEDNKDNAKSKRTSFEMMLMSSTNPNSKEQHSNDEMEPVHVQKRQRLEPNDASTKNRVLEK